MNHELTEFIKFLGLKKPVTVMLKTRIQYKVDGYHVPVYSDKTGELKSHKIVIYVSNLYRPFNTILAHELIHAWQEENDCRSEIHGKDFKRIAKKMSSYFQLENIYVKTLDK